MNFSLRAKLTGIIALAGVLFLLVALAMVWTLSYRQRVASQGANFQSEAAHVAHNLRLVMEENVTGLEALLTASRVGDLLKDGTVSSRVPTPAIEDLDFRWTDLSAESPEVKAILENELSTRLRAFQKFNPLIVEILVADREGRLLAATNKTSDFNQGDESWWLKGMHMKRGEAVLEGLDLDQSSNAFSLDISVPIFAENSDEPLGVMKAVINVSPLFATLAVFSSETNTRGEVVRSDGRILLELSDRKFRPAGKMLPAGAMERLRSDRPAWFIDSFDEEGARMVGYAPVRLLGTLSLDGQIHGEPYYVLISQSALDVLQPLRQRTAVLMLGGILIIFLCSAGGIHLAQKNVIEPIETLRRAAAALAATAENREPSKKKLPVTSNALSAVDSIKTGDEMQSMAEDFKKMATKLLRYQDDLKGEIAAKTAEIQRDLDMAREFQQAFLPRRYPAVPAKNDDSLTLDFHHVYHAAMSVSGDFFDVVKLSDHRAGVLIADVMGHGTRSALVTAILRALLHGLTETANDPGLFLASLNRHFYETMRQAEQLIFVSACYVIFDTRESMVYCASAGHPSPLTGSRVTKEIEPLFRELKSNPALGLMPENTYNVFQRPLSDEDVFVLFTDGVVEALSGDDEEFGVERLRQVFRDKLDQDLVGLTQSILEGVLAFTDHQPPADDICLVTVEALSTKAGKAGREKSIEL